MKENYIQYGSGYQKNNVKIKDIKKAINDVQKMDDEHGAFWVSVLTDDENVIEVNKELQLSIIFKGEESKYQASDWIEVANFYNLLLNEEFDTIRNRIEKQSTI